MRDRPAGDHRPTGDRTDRRSPTITRVTDSDIAVEPSSGLDRSRDLAGWLITPVATLVLAPAVTGIMLLLLAASSSLYPSVCDSVEAVNGCGEKVLGLLVLHFRIFAVLWVLMWALPWWPGLQKYRIALAVLAGLALAAAPVRMAGTPPNLDGTTVDKFALIVTAVVLLVVPITGVIIAAISRHQRAHRVCVGLAIVLFMPGLLIIKLTTSLPPIPTSSTPDPDPQPTVSRCVVYSGSVNRCPGG
jgi:hypothetical protein